MKHHTTTDFFKIGEVQLSYEKNIESPFEKITCSKLANNCIREIIPKEQINYREYMYAFYFNNSNHVVGYHLISLGGITSTLIDKRILMQGALLTNSVAIMLFHNHPSGKLKPSNADILLTEEIKEAARILNLKLLDHLIITEKDYYSFADEGDL
ncbi:JAB domain-containing protein [Tenacibaculum agarivorans]|uniref:JAB domain-containing protein n=1 Tax=Tenacibaculum agarivorans TaxID=1908389 RepID=UPI00094B91F0|nr:JAB domain-containing protein [Tenacibaculum agarivorans]